MKIILGQKFEIAVEEVVAHAMWEAVKLHGLDGNRIAELVAQRITEAELVSNDEL